VAAGQSISSVVPFVVAQVARAGGADPERLLRGSGVPADAAPAAEEHLAAPAYFDVWNRAVAATDPTLPLRVAATFQLEDHEVFGFLAMSCETLGEAYERTAGVRALYCLGARWELQSEADVTRLIWYPWDGDRADAGVRAAMEFAVADMADAIRRLGRTSPRPIAVRMAHVVPPDVAPFTAYYGIAPTYGTPLYELVYPAGLGELPIATFNSRLRDYFEQECKQIVAAVGASERIVDLLRKQLITVMDGGDSSIESVAKRLGTSSRSLQRKLADEGTRYNDVLADVRAEFAKRYLARGTVSASEVAYLIGFTEPPAFFKAFKRWTGMTPREFQLGAAT
jgi:AraC-like DNA-binding protein